jgi:hypothetical protein
MIEYFANTPIASPFPTLPYRFQTLTAENANFRQGLGQLPTSTPLLQAPTSAPPVSAPPVAPSLSINPMAQYIGATPTPAQIQAFMAAQAAQAAQPVEGAPVAPVTGRMGGIVTLAEGGMPKLSPQQAGSRFDVSQYIDPDTGRFYINEFKRDEVFNPRLREAEEMARRANFANGGVASVAQSLANRGRGGDSMLIHMSPEEVAGLQALAQQQGMGGMTINPQTGLPEAFSLKKLFRAALPILPFLPIPGIQGLSLLAKSALSGVIGGFTAPGKGFNFKEGLKTGIMAFAGGKLMEGLQAAGQMGAAAPPTPPTSADFGGVNISSGPQVPGGYGDFSNVSSMTPSASYAAGNITPPPTVSSAPSLTETPTMQGLREAGAGVKNIFTGTPEASAAFESAAGVKPTTAFALGTTGYGLMEGDRERQAFQAAQAARNAEEEERRRRYSALFSRTLGQVPMAASGGIVALAGGGMPTFEYGGTTAPTGEPRMVAGAGDGMSDNVPATIEGVQEARLANDEFVVPADVVADIGNGSSNAGAKKLYAMMDRIRKARHGTIEQPPEIDAERLLPA